jgi:hypothetical protein
VGPPLFACLLESLWRSKGKIQSAKTAEQMHQPSQGYDWQAQKSQKMQHRFERWLSSAVFCVDFILRLLR